ncbi:MAG: DNA-binding transcriptional regulator Fis [Gammaproteobacteria bacterium]|nr:DNA-binding transcriptional regulator Fis [Pseudomonadales bacterium]MCP5349215.1 DNA-binding transcriptional regulator Fis [Pseudomonadales bacterium]
MTSQDEALLFRATPVEGLSDFIETDKPATLREEVKRSMAAYFDQLGGQDPTEIYQLVMNEVEAPLLEIVMQRADFNQCRAATMLGINRGTLRKKLKQYGLL